jgi:hypothetical protein
MRKLLNRKIRQQGGICAICHEEFTDYNDIVAYADIGISVIGSQSKPCLTLIAVAKTQKRGLRFCRPILAT